MSYLARLLLHTAAQAVPTNWVGLINGCPTSSYDYVIGAISSSDGAATFTASGSSCIGPSGSGWRSLYVKDPSVVWDGSQYVVYVHGWNGSNHQVGRFTAPAITGTWTEYGSNPILGVPNDGSWRSNGAWFPYVVYDPSMSPAWKMWALGSQGSGPTLTIGFLDSSDGLSWTDHGRVLGLGSGGDPDVNGLEMGAAFQAGGTWYIYYGAIDGSNFYHNAYATCTDPTDAGTYTKHGVMSGFDNTLTFGGFTWRSNQIRDVKRLGSRLLVTGDAWNAAGHTEEACWSVVSDSLTAIPVPTDLMIALGSGWYANSAENPVVLAL